jgi:hypothetical protein
MFTKPMDVIDAWVGCVNGGDVEGVMALYHEAATLLPTFSDEQRVGLDGIRGYFDKVGEHDGVVVGIHDETVDCREIGDGLYSIIGAYPWKFTDDGEVSDIEARFTFVVNMKESRPIMHHHSSLVPTNS